MIEKNWFESNAGYGIYDFVSEQTKIVRNWFDNNHTQYYLAQLYVQQADGTLIDENRFKNSLNKDYYYAAIRIRDTASNCIVMRNKADPGTGTMPLLKNDAADTKIKDNFDYVTENSGAATFSGDGTTTQFTIAHGLVSTPSNVQVTPRSADAAGDFYVTIDSTNIYVNYSSAPASGTDNVKLDWKAEV